MKKELNKWQIIWQMRDVHEMTIPLLKEFTFGVIKFTSFPCEGGEIEKKHYKGCMKTIRFYKLFEIRF